MALITSILAQTIRAFNRRSQSPSLFRIGPFTNRYRRLAAFVVLLSAVMILYVPFLQTIFETVPLTPGDWAGSSRSASCRSWRWIWRRRWGCTGRADSCVER